MIGGSFDDFPHIKAWLARLLERPAVKKGFAVPLGEKPTGLDPVDDKTREKRQKIKETVDKAKKQYGYKYTSP